VLVRAWEDENALLQEAIFQFKVDIRNEVFQIKPTGDPGPTKPQSMRIRARREPPARSQPLLSLAMRAPSVIIEPD
jgi:hypothetical protein